jgi:hypothetical protein
MYLTLIPAYGRDYSSKAAVLKAWAANQDFIIQSFHHPYDGKPINRQQVNPGDYQGVCIRYGKLRKQVSVE